MMRNVVRLQLFRCPTESLCPTEEVYMYFDNGVYALQLCLTASLVDYMYGVFRYGCRYQRARL